jgi:hypothetical protein
MSRTANAPQSLGKAGRPSAAAIAERPPQRVEACEIPQPPLQGLRNPPCCGVPMAPRLRRRMGSPESNRWRIQCSHCGKMLSVTYTGGMPTMARVL